MTPKQYRMLCAANRVSLPGDGLRIKGPGDHATARYLERRELVRVLRPADPDMKARVMITRRGRELLEEL